MWKSAWVIFAFASALFGGACEYAYAQAAKAEEWGEPANGLRVSLTFSSDKYVRGEPIKCRVRIQNTDENDFTFAAYEPLRLVAFTVCALGIDRQYSIPPHSTWREDVGATRFGHAEGRRGDSQEASPPPLTLKKGETYTVEISALNLLYDFSRDERYEVSVKTVWNLQPQLAARVAQSPKTRITVVMPTERFYTISLQKADGTNKTKNEAIAAPPN